MSAGRKTEEGRYQPPLVLSAIDVTRNYPVGGEAVHAEHRKEQFVDVVLVQTGVGNDGDFALHIFGDDNVLASDVGNEADDVNEICIFETHVDALLRLSIADGGARQSRGGCGKPGSLGCCARSEGFAHLLANDLPNQPVATGNA